MSSYNHKNKNMIYMLRLVVAFLFICASIVTVYFVIQKIGQIKIVRGVTIKNEDVKFVIKTVENQDEIFLIKDENGQLRCKKPDGSFARDEWVEKDNELYYFESNTYGKNGELRIDGQTYTLDKGKLVKIVKDKTYEQKDEEGYFSLVDSISFFAYLESEKNEDGYYPIKYVKYGDEEEDYLGTINDMQVSSPYMIKIYENTIYYLALGNKKDYQGHLYRMKPNGSLREWVGTSVEGYIVLSSDIVYYYDGVRVIKAKNWKEEEVKVLEILEDETLMPIPLEEEGMITPIPSNNEGPNIINAVPIPKDKNDNKNNNVNQVEEPIINNNSSGKREDVIIVEPLPIPKETIVDKNDAKAKSDYTTQKENYINTMTPPVSGKQSYSTNAPGE